MFHCLSLGPRRSNCKLPSSLHYLEYCHPANGPSFLHTPFQPTTFFDISSSIERKIQALSCYRSVLRDPPHSRSESTIRALATLRGSQSGLLYKKLFHTLLHPQMILYSPIKTTSDTLFAFFLLLFLSPLFFLICILVYLEDRRFPFFVSRRIGRSGVPFSLIKFRTMPIGSPLVPSTSTQVSFTRVGKFLRRFSLDELPQLLNVIAGHMSLVGPRPALPTQSNLLSLQKQNSAFPSAGTYWLGSSQFIYRHE